ncbi:MAG: YifB family Mg chelatase-like AAA ATPase [Acidimicrobiia bacterium]
MYSSVTSSAMVGVDPRPVTVEASVSPSAKTSFSIVGLPDAVVRESRDRVRAAIKRQGFTFPLGRVVVSLSPADIPKVGSTYDLPIALSIIGATEEGALDLSEYVCVGELSLDGVVKGVTGVLAAVEVARSEGKKCLASVDSNASSERAKHIQGVRLLGEAVGVAQGTRQARGVEPTAMSAPQSHDLAIVRGQPKARRAMEVAAAGGHHILLNGSPGSGKTLLARCLPSILPRLTPEQATEVALIASAAGAFPMVHVDPPFRAPHHSSSTAALVGGGVGVPRPGEVTRAHHGVLFLDELGEFSPSTLDALRQPIEEGTVMIARASESILFPANIQVVGATNPCPCGFRDDQRTPCRCTESQKDRYRLRLSGPLMDRFDIRVTVDRLRAGELSGDLGESSALVRRRVLAARSIQMKRGTMNRHLSGDQLSALDLTARATRALSVAYDANLMTGRGWDRVRRCARTIADLDASERIDEVHVLEAVDLRTGMR